MHLFTYGTLMFPEVWQAVVGRSFATVGGRAAGFAVYRVRDAVYPGIVVEADATAAGLVYFDVDEESLAALDRFESDFYHRLPVTVVCADGRDVVADCYIVPEEGRGTLTSEPWTAEDFAARGDLARFIAAYAGFGRAVSGAG